MHQYPLFDVKAFRMTIWARRNTPSEYLVLSATGLTCTPHHATISRNFANGFLHVWLDVKHFVRTWEQIDTFKSGQSEMSKDTHHQRWRLQARNHC
jgi:hypothetical protein